ncbi:MAG: nitrous oxide reductase family maturation protein NosD [bacterium]
MIPELFGLMLPKTLFGNILLAVLLGVGLTFLPTGAAEKVPSQPKREKPPARLPKVIEVPGEFISIQKAIDSALPGDTVLLAPGRYKENIRLAPKVHLQGSGVKETKLTRGSKESQEPIIICADGCVIERLTIWGSKVGAKAGVYINDCSPTLRNTNIKQNGDSGIAVYNGARPFITQNAVFNNGYSGINCFDAAPVIVKNRIFRNKGSGLTMMDSEALIKENRIYDNLEVGMLVSVSEEKRNDEDFFDSVIQKNIIQKNLLGGITCELASPTILENKIFSRGKMALSLFTSNSVIRKNELRSSGPPVLRIDQASAPVVEDNLIKGTLRFAILNESKLARLKNNEVKSAWKPQFNPR